MSFETLYAFYSYLGYRKEFEDNRFIFIPSIVVLGPFAFVGVILWILGCLVWLVAKALLEPIYIRIGNVWKTFG